MQIKFEATELKKAKKYVEKLTTKEEELKERRKKKSSSFIKDLFQFLFK
jgi:phosphoglycerol transferase MdoB-like AlkP superfamily enzyme